MRAYLNATEIRAEYRRSNFSLEQALQEIEIALDYWNRCLEYYELSKVDSLPSNFESRYPREKHWEILKAFKEKKFLIELKNELDTLSDPLLPSPIRAIGLNPLPEKTEMNQSTVITGLPLVDSIDRYAPAEHPPVFRKGIDSNDLEALSGGKYVVLTSLQRYFSRLTSECPEIEITANLFKNRLLNSKNQLQPYTYKSIETEIQKARS
jgi:hypothetical protein